MSLIERLKRELGSAKNVTTMDHVGYQDALAVRSLIQDFEIASLLVRADVIIALAEGDFDEEVEVILH